MCFLIFLGFDWFYCVGGVGWLLDWFFVMLWMFEFFDVDVFFFVVFVKVVGCVGGIFFVVYNVVNE